MDKFLQGRILFIGSLFSIFASSSSAQQLAALADLSLEELGEIMVTSVSRREESVNSAAASVFVITSEELRRSGVTSLPEALRLAPNLQFAQRNASEYSITSRGGNSTTANKLLVLIDGRTVYTPLYSGVFWDAQHVMIEDIDRIEVISGPGATLWGANAVNGVINVISKKSENTQGKLLALEAGNREQSIAFRQGGKFENGGHYRVFGKTFHRANTQRADGSDVRDDARNGQVGFRADWGQAENGFTVQGELYDGTTEQVSNERDISGANLLARWTRAASDGSSLVFQTYYDRTKRVHPTIFRETLDTIDFEFQHGLPVKAGHQILWGAGYRHSHDRVGNSAGLAFLPAEKRLNYTQAFIQDQVTVTPKLDVTVGLKLEHNPYTNLEYLPNLRVAYKASNDSLYWGALSRAVRAPSRIDREFFVPGTAPYTVVAGGPDFESEIAKVIEFGYRGQPSKTVSYSVTAFHHRYDNLRSLEPRPAGPILENLIEGTMTGVEAWGSYRLSERWRVSGGLTEMNSNWRRDAASQDTAGLRSLRADPERTFLLRSSYDFSPRHTVDLTLRHVDDLPEPKVPSYTAVDGRVGWAVTPELEASLVVRNMFDRRHAEWGDPATRSELERSVMLKLLWRL